MKLSSRARSSASSSGKASLNSSWVGDDSVGLGDSSRSRPWAERVPRPGFLRKESALQASIRHHNLMAVATVLGPQAMAVGLDGTPIVDDKQVLALWSVLKKRSRLGHAEIVESLVDVARQCLIHDCTPREFAKRLRHAPVDPVMSLHEPNADDVTGQVRWVLLLGRLTLDKVVTSLPLAGAGGVPHRQLREKQAMVDQQAARLVALEMWCEMARGDARFGQDADAVDILVDAAARHAKDDVGGALAAFRELVLLCEDLGPQDLLEDTRAVLREAEETLERDGAVFAQYLEPVAAAPAVSIADRIEALLKRQPERPLSYWTYCCEHWMQARQRALEDQRRRIQSARDHLTGQLHKQRPSRLVVGRTLQVLEVARTVKELSGYLARCDRGAEAERTLFQLRALLVDMRTSEKADKRLGGAARPWMRRLVDETCLPRGRNCHAKAMARIWVSLGQHLALLDELVNALVASELARLEAALAEVLAERQALASTTGPLHQLRVALLVRVWEASLPPTTVPYASDTRGFWGTAAYSMLRDGVCTYVSRLVMDSIATAIRDLACESDSVPDELVDWLAFAFGGGLTVYSLYRMHAIRRVPEIEHRQSTFADVLKWSSGLLVAVQAVGGLGVTVAQGVMGASGVSAVAYRLWSEAVWSSAVIETSRWLREALQRPLTLQAPGIPGLGPRIKTIELRRLDGQMMPPAHAIEFHSIRDGGYTAATTLLSGSLGQVDLKTLAFGLSRIGLAVGEAADAAWPEIAKLIFAARHPEEYRVVVKDMGPTSWSDTLEQIDTQAAARSAFGGWVNWWANFTAMMYELYAESHTEAMRVLAFVGGFVLGATTAPRSRTIDDYMNAFKGYVVTSGLMPRLYGALVSGIPPLKRQHDAHERQKIEQRCLALDQTIGRAAYQTAQRFRCWVEALAKTLASVPADARPDFNTVLHQQWRDDANPLAHLDEPVDVRDLLQAWRKEVKGDSRQAAHRLTIGELLKTVPASPVIGDADMQAPQALV
ncbi:MAG: hypothetical protein GTN84_17820 [Hydrogenophaga sp.]|uniref:hypothetical protein n=1 Tax=Hydrogenophaga sp. TaxID=1904254 RepID=UPI001698531A|nr:hypothetical protein [Hydrogenophaga sp.]NIM43102.1 hypothetical protein [Hydrogenophaga sp.]NIN28170.1 hypothetical protein [Hydrogenophaga sp.]NIN30608.1 hypothetical protein [Hydrogenophaga sp.]NIN57305.1 hypothetical protein [Hydrogenophaga sp.]NIO51524.1 hypothetical protein [Hydrogenophaga sp.]